MDITFECSDAVQLVKELAPSPDSETKDSTEVTAPEEIEVQISTTDEKKESPAVKKDAGPALGAFSIKGF